jgi:hypothetical protein
LQYPARAKMKLVNRVCHRRVLETLEEFASFEEA